MKKICNNCNKEQPTHFFYNDVCIPCAASSDVKAKKEASKDYEIVEDKGCAGGACTL